MGFLALLGLGAAGYFGYKLYNQGNSNQLKNIFPGSPTADNSLQILNERLAKGEITTEEYEHIKATLTNNLL